MSVSSLMLTIIDIPDTSPLPTIEIHAWQCEHARNTQYQTSEVVAESVAARIKHERDLDIILHGEIAHTIKVAPCLTRTTP